MNFFFFHFLRIILQTLSKLPHSLLYAFSSVLAFMLEYIFGYRKKVIYDNLQRAFPKKNTTEIKLIAHQYYQHLSDLVVEFLIGISAEESFFEKNYQFKNAEVLHEIIHQNKPVIILLGHTGNWEWGIFRTNYFHSKNFVVYKKISNGYFEQWMKKIRTRTGAMLLEMNETGKILAAQKNESFTLSLVADQAPVNAQNSFWTMFLNQETGFFRGPALFAKMLDANIVYSKITKPERGRYEVEFIPLREAEDITLQYVQLLENHIAETPEIWLWSHKRWKRKRPENKKLIQR